jgi:hypothetical protein
MTKYLINPTSVEASSTTSTGMSQQEKPNGNVYDLCAVINHLGQSISMGHYTSFARTHDKQNSVKSEVGWRYFDDQRVVSVDAENHVLTKDAYVLMYRLRSNGVDDITELPEQASSSLQTPVISQTTSEQSGGFTSVPMKSDFAASVTHQRANNESESDFEPVGQNEEFDEADSDESAQPIEEDDRDEAIDQSDNDESLDEKMVMSVNNSTLGHDFTNLDETD